MLGYFSKVPIPETGLTCPYPGCTFSSSDKHQLMLHANDQHIHFEAFNCSLCSSKFKTFKALNEHLEEKHPDYIYSQLAATPAKVDFNNTITMQVCLINNNNNNNNNNNKPFFFLAPS